MQYSYPLVFGKRPKTFTLKQENKMDNQHRKITGYRELDQTDIDLMNEVKALGIQMESVLKKVESLIQQQYMDENDQTRMNNATPHRFLSIAKTDFQTGLMAATRAVAQPEFF
jgi:hypothetical protein